VRLLEKRSVSLSGHATSVALEPEFWAALEAQAAALGETLAQRLIAVDAERGQRTLASACRVATLAWAMRREG
jgi:predicted DNA-binding ribbon-helix-helix protein